MNGLAMLFALLLAVAVVAIIVLLVKYMRLQAHIHSRVQEELVAWRSSELDSVSAHLQVVAQSEARVSLDRWQAESEANIRSDAIRRSSAVVTGKVTEHLAPCMGAFPYNPKDVRFLGSPIDLVVFDGMSEDNPREIIFLEIKTSTA